MAQFLVDQGTLINSLNNRNQTALVLAAELGHTEAAEVLIKNGADLHIQEKVLIDPKSSNRWRTQCPQSGRTALYVASRGSFQAIVDMLIKAERDNTLRPKSSSDGFSGRSGDQQNNDCCDANDHRCRRESNESIQINQMKKILWNLSRYHLEVNDWKRLAKIWDFTEEQIKGITDSFISIYMIPALIYIYDHEFTFNLDKNRGNMLYLLSDQWTWMLPPDQQCSHWYWAYRSEYLSSYLNDFQLLFMWSNRTSVHWEVELQRPRLSNDVDMASRTAQMPKPCPPTARCSLGHRQEGCGR